jgi:C-terminal processing protease CtpA/Prc
VEPVGVEQFEAWAGWLAYTGLPPRDGLRHTAPRTEPFSVEMLPDGTTAYVRYHRVGDVSRQQVDELRAVAAAPGTERVIVDLRQNPGGDNHNYPPILEALRDEAIDRPGRLLVLTDRITFSAASNFSTEIEQRTSALFFGEPMGGGLNFWNDVDWVELPDFPVPMRLGVSTIYWQKAEPDDPRLSIDPDVPVPARAADYFGGLDPVLEAALAH